MLQSWYISTFWFCRILQTFANFCKLFEVEITEQPRVRKPNQRAESSIHIPNSISTTLGAIWEWITSSRTTTPESLQTLQTFANFLKSRFRTRSGPGYLPVSAESKGYRYIKIFQPLRQLLWPAPGSESVIIKVCKSLQKFAKVCKSLQKFAKIIFCYYWWW